MRGLQFWILLLGSSFVSILLIKEISLSRALYQEERQLADSQETAAAGQGYETAWKQLAIHLYQASHQDPTLSDVLKTEKIVIRTTTSPTPVPPAPGATAPPAPISSKTTGAAPHAPAPPAP